MSFERRCAAGALAPLTLAALTAALAKDFRPASNERASCSGVMTQMGLAPVLLSVFFFLALPELKCSVSRYRILDLLATKR
jgi:hypothetical protein